MQMKQMKVKEIPFRIVRTVFRPFMSRGPAGLPIVKKILRYYFWASLQGHRMYVNARDRAITPTLLNDGCWEKYETELFRRVVKKGMTVLDLGANIGWYTLIAAKIVGKKGKVYAFEPDPDNCALLRKNVQINGYNNIIVEQKAVLNKCQHIRLFLANDNLGDNRIYCSNDSRKWITVEGTTLDEYFRNKHDKIDVIKIDVQGAEMAVFLGMSGIIEASENLKIFLEFSPLLIQEYGFSPEDFLNKLLEHGLKIFVIDRRKETVVPMHVDEIMDLFNGSHLGYVDLFLQR